MKINFENKTVTKTVDNIFLILFFIPLAVSVLSSFAAFVLLISARIFFFLVILTLYPILLILKRLFSGKYDPVSPFKYAKSTIKYANSFFLDILDFCLYYK
nr:MAG TPA: hypothetical protein [Caudoviricetes sp.]